ncbi:unnamed protein product (macronuclear) [Paramecium tetraurelia]|uniref:Dynactin subunit 4 n=1 Tax=Paramecium tetraurelia TaxID=5888 RepID=A0CEV0_PARTE|nr:uncharacterized protein GSPATT00037756001 [Paramecium tetraurelia]CAK69317.1 unnamed protein product [Paramecium tetraurelia]|eukprot:XP_001436714.1 hypothetical protein (macronuclear) [Paramecium tetraurelia strain d4-2]
MFQFKKIAKLPLILIQCECGREFLQEEMYCCLSCQNSMCRYCTSNEIFCYYCRNCGDVQITSETSNLTVNCSSCFESPVCKNVLRRQIDTEKNYAFTCSYCFYTTRSIGVADPNFQQVYTKINNAYKQEYEAEYKDFQEQQNRIKCIENSNFLTKIQQKKQTCPKIIDIIMGKKRSLDSLKWLKKKTQKLFYKVELQDYNPISQNATLLPIPLGLLSRKNRKCRKCSKLILTLQPEKNSKKFAYSVQNLHYDHAPYLQIGKVSYVNKEKTELQVVIQMFNKSKNALEYSLQPLDSQTLEQYKLLIVKNLPSPTFTFNNENIESDVQQYQKFEAILLIKDATKIQFAFSVTAKIKMPLDLQQLNYNVNVYIGTL